MLHVAKAPVPHPSTDKGKEFWREFAIRRRQLAMRPNVLALGIWDDRQLVGELDILPISDDGLAVEIGYDILEAFRRKGYATLAARAAADYAISERGVEDVFAKTSLSNHASQAVLRRAGFIQFRDINSELYFTYDPQHLFA